MTSLQIHHIDDWGTFITENDIDLSCSACHGKGCEECSESGYIEPMWNTIWNTGYHNGEQSVPAHFENVLAFVWNGEIWFGLSCCGMDCTPYLAQAWIEMFPDCQWLPDQFIVSGCNLSGGYIEACISKNKARKVYTLIGKTIRGMRREAKNLADDLREARTRLKKPAA